MKLCAVHFVVTVYMALYSHCSVSPLDCSTIYSLQLFISLFILVLTPNSCCCAFCVQ
jgi:hypothetical protein